MSIISRTNLAMAAVATSLLLSAPFAAAADVGLGVNLNTNSYGGNFGYGISMPIRFGNISVEPEVAYNQSTYDNNSTTPSNVYRSKYEQYSIETGIFVHKEVAPSLEIYGGGRIGAYGYKYSNGYPNNPGANNESRNHGYMAGPTVGAEYFFDKQVSVGLDVSLLYQSGSQSSSGGDGVDSSQINLQGRAKLRFYF